VRARPASFEAQAIEPGGDLASGAWRPVTFPRTLLLSLLPCLGFIAAPSVEISGVSLPVPHAVDEQSSTTTTVSWRIFPLILHTSAAAACSRL
jgi:hypothetical protein